MLRGERRNSRSASSMKWGAGLRMSSCTLRCPGMTDDSRFIVRSRHQMWNTDIHKPPTCIKDALIMPLIHCIHENTPVNSCVNPHHITLKHGTIRSAGECLRYDFSSQARKILFGAPSRGSPAASFGSSGNSFRLGRCWFDLSLVFCGANQST